MPLNSLTAEDYDVVADSIESLLDLIASLDSHPDGKFSCMHIANLYNNWIFKFESHVTLIGKHKSSKIL